MQIIRHGSALCVITITLLAAFAAVPAFSSTPVFPESGISAEAFVPSGWKIMAQAEGDLNKDGIPDAALVLRESAEEKEGADTADMKRILVILFGASSGGYKLSATSKEAVLCKDCGGVFGDPFVGIKIVRGVIVIDHYGGSRNRWGYTHRWRYQDGDWFLVGLTSRQEDILEGTSEVTDINLITGNRIVEKGRIEGKMKSTRSQAPKTPLPKLSSFTFQY
jgi:hypothetical protein